MQVQRRACMVRRQKRFDGKITGSTSSGVLTNVEVLRKFHLCLAFEMQTFRSSSFLIKWDLPPLPPPPLELELKLTGLLRNSTVKPVSVMENSVGSRMAAAGNVGAAIVTHVVRSVHSRTDTVICN